MSNYESRQRVSWLFLLGSFVLFVLLCVGSILLGQFSVQNATRPLQVHVQANNGTISLDNMSGARQALRAGEPVAFLRDGDRIVTDMSDTAVFQVYPAQSQEILSRVQVYGGTSVRIVEANEPRFEWSSRVRQLALRLVDGRLRLSIPFVETGEPFSLHIMTDHGHVNISEAGQYAIEVVDETLHMSVLAGESLVSIEGEDSLLLTADERALVSQENGIEGPFDTERNLIFNSNFDQGSEGWRRLAWNVERLNQPEGDAQIVSIESAPALKVRRVGIGHADVEMRQLIDQDVTDYQSLHLRVWLRVMMQDLAVCGNVGTECPLMVRIAYEDESGGDRIWQQGFFSVGEVSTEMPNYCIGCGFPQSLSEHVRVQPSQVAVYDSINLIEVLGDEGVQPMRIKSISLVFAGHTFDVDVLEVSLMAQE